MLIHNKTIKENDFLDYFGMAYLLAADVNRAYETVKLLEEKDKELEKKCHESLLQIQSLQAEIERLKEQLQLRQLRQFGKKTEIGEPIENPPEREKETVSGYTRNKKVKTRGRLIDTSGLPRKEIHHDLCDSQKTCHCCKNSLHEIGTETSEQLEIVPARVYVAVHIRHKYGCRTCDTVIMAYKEPSPLPKAIAGGSLLTEIILSKYQYHLPLYRQSKILASVGCVIPDNTLGNWMMQVGEALVEIYQALWVTVLSTRYLQVDETPVKVLNPEKKAYIWTYLAPLVGKGTVIFEFDLTRKSEVAEKRLGNYKGLLHTDGYGGYDGLRKKKTISGLGCITHARRKFVEIFKISKNPEGIAAQAIEKLKPLYALESRMRELGCSFHTRKRLRQKIAWPLLKAFKAWLEKQLPQVPPKSQLAVAIHYTLNQWPYLIAYLRHGMAEIDTNWVENKIREIALGKKNWLFMGNEDSGQVHAIFFSLIATAMMNDLNPRVYIHYLLSNIHAIRKKAIDPMTLLPHTINKEKLQRFIDKEIARAKDFLNTS